ncbi:MAG: sigma-70 family RNA polymerase sigma factor [Clostridia bacterium]|nr:sigma-70 family RNA polymerase sigma factor [Clostridia bacterium]
MRGIRQEQLTEYISQYGRLIFTICLSFTGNRFDAEDLTQETFLAACKHLGSFDGRSPKAWLTTIAANKCRDYLKSPARDITALTDEDWSCIEDKHTVPEEEILKCEADEEVYRLCMKLKEPYRRVSLAYFVRGAQLSELALQTGCSLKTLQTQLYRAKHILRELWKKECM